MTNRIMMADPGAGYRACAAEYDAAIRRVLLSGHYVLGSEVEGFEREFAHYLGVAGVVGVANGTDALELALRAAGIGPGDSVLTVANTATATVAAIVATGAAAKFVEIEPGTMLMDADALERRLSTANDPSIKAVLPVHLYGQVADMPRLMEIARRHGLSVIEDCAQAHGAAVAGRKAGAWGDLAAFSFYPTKNLGAFGDGGAVAGSDTALLERVRLLRQYGWRQRHVSMIHGRNSRLDEMQAALLRVRLAKRLDAENGIRATLAARYLEGLKDVPIRLPHVAGGRDCAWHLFVMQTPRRDALADHLARHDIFAQVHYPMPIHRQPAYEDPSLTLPITERSCAEVLSLPLHPGLAIGDIDRVCAKIREWAA